MSRTMENKIGRLVSGIGQNAKDVLEKTKNLAVQVADQNDDGKFDMEDVSVMASSFGDAVKKGAHSLKETVDEKSKQMEIKTLKPFFKSWNSRAMKSSVENTLPLRVHGRNALSVSRHWVLGTARKKSRRCWLVRQSILPI